MSYSILVFAELSSDYTARVALPSSGHYPDHPPREIHSMVIQGGKALIRKPCRLKIGLDYLNQFIHPLASYKYITFRLLLCLNIII